MSDTNILSGEEVTIHLNAIVDKSVRGYNFGEHLSALNRSHDAQAQRIAELVAKVNQERDWFSEAQKERDAALRRAEAAEAQVKALLEAMPAERAEEIADMPSLRPDSNRDALRAYAEAAKPKER